MAGYDGHRGWLYAVAVSQQSRRSGVGTALVRTAEAALQDLGCSKINLQVRVGNEEVTSFYRGLGYAIEERISMGRYRVRWLKCRVVPQTPSLRNNSALIANP